MPRRSFRHPHLKLPFVYASGGTRPERVTIADLDGDGHNDILVANRGTSAFCPGNDCAGDDLGILFNNGDGTFAPTVAAPAGHRPIMAACGDLDGDGDLDIVSSNWTQCDGGLNQIAVLENLGSGVFASPLFFVVDDHNVEVELADLDHDGDLDVVVSNMGGGPVCTAAGWNNTVSILFNNGGSPISFAAHTDLITASRPRDIELADVNGDGEYDLAVGALNAGRVQIFRGSDSGGFNPEPLQELLEAEYPSALRFGDINRDQVVDLVSANGFTAFPETGETIQLYHGQGDGTFVFQSSPTVSATDGAPIDVALADFNGDLNIDMMTANFLADTVGIRNSAGKNPSVSSIAIGDGPAGVAVGDLDGNGTPDAVVTLFLEASVAVLLNAFNTSVGTVTLEEPGNMVVAVDVDPVFNWTNATGDGVTYTLELATDSSFNTIAHVEAGIAQSTFDLPVQDSLAKGTIYYWRVIAGNAFGYSATSSSFWFETIRIGDFNSDGCVNGADLANLLASWGTTGEISGTDINGDGIVNGADLAALLANWHDPCSGQDPPQSLMMEPEDGGAFEQQAAFLEYDDEVAQSQSSVPWILLELGWTIVDDYLAWTDGLTEQEMFDHIADVLAILLGD